MSTSIMESPIRKLDPKQFSDFFSEKRKPFKKFNDYHKTQQYNKEQLTPVPSSCEHRIDY